jgi:hypothetical protein
MRFQPIKSVLLLSTLVLGAASLTAQSSAKFTGTLTDSMCGKKHATPTAASMKCTKECIKGGSDYALVSGDKVYTIKGDKAELDKYAGEAVTVEGDSDGKVITVKSIKSAS